MLTNVNRGGVKWDWWIAAANILVNLLILAVYKYFNFFADSFVAVCEAFGFHPDRVTLHLVLPVGISFYTFQALSYTIDVYKRKLEPTHDVVAFFAFISFFPQLVAGPIERATHLLPQFLKPRTFKYERGVDGVRLILWGLFKKMVIADNCATVVNIIWENYETMSGANLWMGAILFTFQIYGDFSGYSDIAIGSAKLFGIDLMRNFNVPNFSRDIAEFWRRWHISLTTWFRDYIYIPLGGSRCAKWKVARNTLIIYLVSGLWHGANWTYVIWGAYHALLFFPLILLGKNRKYRDTVASGRLLPSPKEFLQMVRTFFLVMIGLVIFRAESIQQAVLYLKYMFTHFQISMPEYGRMTMLYCLLFVIVEWMSREKEHPLQIAGKDWKSWGLDIVAILIIASLASKGSNQFIYFQF
jgi:D-alanyl-lipoteichoic acid acyltransferase DltB (MBOAT superfamily)